MVHSYQEAIDFLYGALPMYQRVGAVAFRNDLTNTIALCNALGNPEQKFKSIHIAGTNGKGSTSHMLAAVLQSAGYKTGLYTSPHLKSFTERIKINGADVSAEFVVDFVNRIQPTLQTIEPSFFEMTVAMAFDYFVRERTDLAVIETGLGGRLDSTNVVSPLLSVITNISFDHMEFLGSTLPAIAMEKAGIIKPRTPVVVSEWQDDVTAVFEAKAASEDAPLVFASDVCKVTRVNAGIRIEWKGQAVMDGITPDLKGDYQLKNIAGTFTAIQVLRQSGYTIPDASVVQGLEATVKLTGLKGRWQQLGTNPLVIADTGHNEAGIKEILQQLSGMKYNRLHVVFGMVKDKSPKKILDLLPREANYYFCQASIPRARDAGELATIAGAHGLKGVVIPDVNAAIRRAKSQASADDVIWIGGSTFVVAEADGL